MRQHGKAIVTKFQVVAGILTTILTCLGTYHCEDKILNLQRVSIILLALHGKEASDQCWLSNDISKEGLALRQSPVRWPGIEPGSTAWKAAMLTTIPPTH